MRQRLEELWTDAEFTSKYAGLPAAVHCSHWDATGNRSPAARNNHLFAPTSPLDQFGEIRFRFMDGH